MHKKTDRTNFVFPINICSIKKMIVQIKLTFLISNKYIFIFNKYLVDSIQLNIY